MLHRPRYGSGRARFDISPSMASDNDKCMVSVVVAMANKKLIAMRAVTEAEKMV